MVAAAYAADSSPILNIPLADIYAVATTSGRVPRMHLDKIKPWINVRFFAIAPPGCSTPLLYTPTSFQVIEAADESLDYQDPTSTLVLVVPAGAMVRITDSTRQPAITCPESHPVYGKWMQHDLRRDLLHLVHTNNDHPSLAHTLRALREMCWFPQMVPYTKYHVGVCPLCMPKTRAQRAIGASIIAAHRLWVVYVDHFVLSGNIPALSGVSHILTLMCSRTSFSMFIVVDSDSARDTATAIHNRWYPLLGVPLMFKSDRGPGFASKCMESFRSMVGVKKWAFSAADDATHHSLLEHKHKLLDDVLSTAEAKGDIKSRADLEYYTASALGRQNLFSSSSDDFSPFEAITGQAPHVTSDLATDHDMPTPSAEVDKKFLKKVRFRVDDELAWSSQKRDEVARRNALRRDHVEQSSKTVRSSLVVGDQASLHGFRVTITELLNVTPSGPTKAEVAYSSGITDIVNYHALRPMADPTPELMKPRDMTLDDGVFIFFDAPSGYIHGGVIRGSPSPDGLVSVHDCQGNDKQTRKYTPLYSKGKGDPSPHDKAPKDPAIKPVILTISVDDIIIAGSSNKSHFIDKDLLAYVESLGTVMMPLMLSDPEPSSAALRAEEVNTLRALLTAACLNPFGPLHALLHVVPPVH